MREKGPSLVSMHQGASTVLGLYPLWSKADMSLRNRHVHFTPESGHMQRT
jgi:hypothetical protein